jgi:hypothetical protein
MFLDYNFVTEETDYLVREVRYGVGLRRKEIVVHYIGALPYLVVTLTHVGVGNIKKNYEI